MIQPQHLVECAPPGQPKLRHSVDSMHLTSERGTAKQRSTAAYMISRVAGLTTARDRKLTYTTDAGLTDAPRLLPQRLDGSARRSRSVSWLVSSLSWLCPSRTDRCSAEALQAKVCQRTSIRVRGLNQRHRGDVGARPGGRHSDSTISFSIWVPPGDSVRAI